MSVRRSRSSRAHALGLGPLYSVHRSTLACSWYYLLLVYSSTNLSRGRLQYNKVSRILMSSLYYSESLTLTFFSSTTGLSSYRPRTNSLIAMSLLNGPRTSSLRPLTRLLLSRQHISCSRLFHQAQEVDYTSKYASKLQEKAKQ